RIISGNARSQGGENRIRAAAGTSKETEIPARLDDDRLPSWRNELNRTALSEFMPQVVWSLPLLALLSSSITFALAVHWQVRNAVFGLGWIGIFAVAVAAFSTLVKQSSVVSGVTLAALTASVTMMWPVLLIVIDPSAALDLVVLIGALYLAYSTFPFAAANFA